MHRTRPSQKTRFCCFVSRNMDSLSSSGELLCLPSSYTPGVSCRIVAGPAAVTGYVGRSNQKVTMNEAEKRNLHIIAALGSFFPNQTSHPWDRHSANFNTHCPIAGCVLVVLLQ